MSSSRITTALKLALAGLLALSAMAVTADTGTAPTRVSVKANGSTIIDTFACGRVTKQPPAGTVTFPNATDGKVFMVFTPSGASTDDQPFSVAVGDKTDSPDKPCANPAARDYSASFSFTPTVSDAALSASFKILMAAFVLALLLESAFALLFNWRVFLAFFVGKAIRTPIMFIGALMVVRTFDFDLIASLLNAYYPQANQKDMAGGWFTSIFTAMILAGGSAGVNSIMVKLGVRVDKREEIAPDLEPTEAWVSVEVLMKKTNAAADATVQITEVTPAAGVNVPTTVGRVSKTRASLGSLFFPRGSRVPQSGGRKVEVAKYYSITVYDETAGKTFDMTGKVVDDYTAAKPFKFGPRAIIDFVVYL